MTDIVERLRKIAIAGATGEAAAEIERLRGEVKTKSGRADQLSGMLDRADDEIERLRTANEYAFGPQGELAKLREEVRRLNTSLQTLTGIVKTGDKNTNENKAKGL